MIGNMTASAQLMNRASVSDCECVRADKFFVIYVRLDVCVCERKYIRAKELIVVQNTNKAFKRHSPPSKAASLTTISLVYARVCVW